MAKQQLTPEERERKRAIAKKSRATCRARYAAWLEETRLRREEIDRQRAAAEEAARQEALAREQAEAQRRALELTKPKTAWQAWAARDYPGLRFAGGDGGWLVISQCRMFFELCDTKRAAVARAQELDEQGCTTKACLCGGRPQHLFWRLSDGPLKVTARPMSENEGAPIDAYL